MGILNKTHEYHPDSVESVMRRVGWRLLPLLFLMYIVNYLDRINIGFAALTMNRDLGLSATAFGFAGTIFYIGYVAFEVPSNLLMVRFGARRWLARIMITWGVASALTMLAVNETSLYVIRFIVGVLEAGFTPGVLLYLTYWFPKAYRARANALFMIGGPVAMATGAAASGFILQHGNGVFGLAGWRMMFLLEGLPAIILGFVALFWLADKPSSARWLSTSEAGALERVLSESNSTRADGVLESVGRLLRNKHVLLLSFAYFCLANTFNANATWTPTIVRSVLKSHSLSFVGLITALPAIFAIIFMPIWTFSSDRRGERRWHLVLALGLTAVGWILVAAATNPVVRLVGVLCTTAGSFSAMSIFWTLPQESLSEAARPGGIAVISAVGLLGSAVSPSVIGMLRDLTHSFASGLYYAASLLVVAIALVLLASARRPEPVVPLNFDGPLASRNKC